MGVFTIVAPLGSPKGSIAPRFYAALWLSIALMPVAVSAQRPASATTRVPWTTSQLVGSPDPPPPLRAVRIYPNLQLERPVTLRDLPGTGRLAVLSVDGRIVTFDAAATDVVEPDVLIDLDESLAKPAGEKFASARDMEIDPNFSDNGYLYVMWSIQPMLTAGGTRITRLTVDRQTLVADPSTRLDLITYESGDHIGTSLRFGPDGMFHITTGDGARPFPPDEYKTAQNLADLRGAVLRIDVSAATAEQPYRIPADNPFVDRPGARGEIYAFGIRNGFRSTFEPDTGRLWLADVGWERCEFIHRIEPGGNHGWSLREGPYEVDLSQSPGPGPVISPAIVMPREQAQSITGGPFIPDDSRLAAGDRSMAGRLLFGCYMNGSVWAADVSNLNQIDIRPVAKTGLRLVDFHVTRLSDTPAGMTEMVAVDNGGGGLYRLVAPDDGGGAAVTQNAAFARRLGETGLYTDLATMRTAPGVVAYAPAATMHRGGAIGQRAIGLPTTEPIDFSGRPRYPAGTALVNTLWRDVVGSDETVLRTKIETQILLFDGLNWDPYTYRWADDQSDAALVDTEGDVRSLTVPDDRFGPRTIQHRFASRSTCQSCHHVFNSGPITLRPENLWRENLLPEDSSEPTVGHQGVYTRWSDLIADGHVIGPSEPPKNLMAAVDDLSADLSTRARSYLEMNCSACHRPAGGATTNLHLRHGIPPEKMMAIGERPMQGDFGLRGAQIIAPGHPQRSVLMYRLATAGPGHMPKIAYQDPDLVGGRVIWQWIQSLDDDESSPSMSQTSADTTSDWLLRWHRLATTPDDAVAKVEIDQALWAHDPIAAGLFEPWQSPENRRVGVGDDPDPQSLLAVVGDAITGQRWYEQSSASQCRSCHGGGGAVDLIGPSLAGIGTRMSPRQLLDAILRPSAQIDPKWQTEQLLTLDGQAWTGLVTTEDDETLTLRTADGKTVTVALEDIELRRTSDQSLMPAGLLAALTAQEVADLIAYLRTL